MSEFDPLFLHRFKDLDAAKNLQFIGPARGKRRKFPQMTVNFTRMAHNLT